jgi:cyclic-di-GMP phosphodiesterase TipF (flagellum assembly factor)
MRRLSAIFVAICMVLISGSIGAVLYLRFGVSAADSALVAVATLTCLVLYNAVATRLRDRGDLGGQIADLSRGTADLARQVGDIGRRVAGLENRPQEAVDKALAATKPIAAELSELGAIIKQLAETVADHDNRLRALQAAVPGSAAAAPEKPPLVPPSATAAAPAPAASSGSFPAGAPSAGDGTTARAEEPAPANAIASGPFKGLTADAIIALLREAVEANRIDLFLQPIVTLPQRKVRYYEAVARLRTGDGELVLPADFLPHAEAGGLMPKIDNAMLFRCVQVVRRLMTKNRDVGVFCNVSPSTLVDSESFPQFTEFMEANRAIAPALMLEFSQAAHRAMGPIEAESLAALADRGYRFSMDQVTDLRIEPRDLADRGYRFVKVPSALLLDRNGALASDIHPADFSGLLSRFGIDLVATHIESEAAVVDLLDYEVRYGQGFLFSPPRPVRPEVMQGLADRNDLVVREAPPPAAEPPRPVQRITSLAQLARGVVARG